MRNNNEECNICNKKIDLANLKILRQKKDTLKLNYNIL